MIPLPSIPGPLFHLCPPTETLGSSSAPGNVDNNGPLHGHDGPVYPRVYVPSNDQRPPPYR
jgi:hypothetical protein